MTTDTTPAPVTTTGVDRRSVVRTAAWSLPVIAVSAQAPAYAASCNQLYAGRLNPVRHITRVSDIKATAVVPLSGGGGSVTINFDTTVSTDYAPSTGNYTVDTPIGGTGLSGLQFGYNNSNTNGASTQWYRTTLTFSRNVYNLSFLVTDLDNTGGHDERLVIQNATFTRSFPPGSDCVGAGTGTNPIRNAVPGDPQPDTGTAGNVRINIAGPDSVFTLQFFNAAGSASNNNNWLTDMTFESFSDGCV